MDTSQIYIIISIVVLAIVAMLVFVVSRNKAGKEKALTPLAGLAFGFILAGLFASGSRLVGYGLMGIGVILAVIDMIIKLKKK